MSTNSSGPKNSKELVNFLLSKEKNQSAVPSSPEPALVAEASAEIEKTIAISKDSKAPVPQDSQVGSVLKSDLSDNYLASSQPKIPKPEFRSKGNTGSTPSTSAQAGEMPYGEIVFDIDLGEFKEVAEKKKPNEAGGARELELDTNSEVKLQPFVQPSAPVLQPTQPKASTPVAPKTEATKPLETAAKLFDKLKTAQTITKQQGTVAPPQRTQAQQAKALEDLKKFLKMNPPAKPIAGGGAGPKVPTAKKPLTVKAATEAATPPDQALKAPKKAKDTASVVTPPKAFSDEAFRQAASLMGGAEVLRTAQDRIAALEKERDRLRDENDKIVAASEILQRRIESLRGQVDGGERKLQEKIEILEEERAVLKGRLTAREGELAKLKTENEQFNDRFQADLRKVRVRERELENRIELMKSENTTLIRSKDEMILALKRSHDQHLFEMETLRAKLKEHVAEIGAFNERGRKIAKALRMALSLIESGGDIAVEEQSPPAKKASGQ